MIYSLYNQSNEFNQTKYEPLIKELIETIEVHLKLPKDRIFELFFVDDDEIREINFNYREKDSITDVVSLESDPSHFSPILGEVYVCIPQTQRQAITYQHSFERELCFLITHGILHLLGYDHLNVEDEKVMFGLQEEILNKLGITRHE
ncbi:rRNA maturation RNase YbeY [Ureaplasma miroungigenitalium]|uniref:Endoribonuclease YbeY n=1 Tax=Ureaplasma miroungigenitalium TaxID=1042321 RepID=A0ABT3BMY7_9BACT|nr:rRNA maturation RNase YbeY [Ureaplasma miroungigenitalium]MCV3728589.1 rRNA maturation RNase YbeY [Ureaplasma miroungigenitalium]